MMDNRDPAIKLFGMKIPFPAVFESAVTVEEEEEEEEELSGGDGGENKSPEKVLILLCNFLIGIEKFNFV